MSLFKAPKIPYARLEALYAELASQYRLLRDSKTQPAPNDSEWQKRFSELEHEFDMYREERTRRVQENWTSSANFREAKMHLREFLKYMERE